MKNTSQSARRTWQVEETGATDYGNGATRNRAYQEATEHPQIQQQVVNKLEEALAEKQVNLSKKSLNLIYIKHTTSLYWKYSIDIIWSKDVWHLWALTNI